VRAYYYILWSYQFSLFATNVLNPIYAFFVKKVGGGMLETSTSLATFSIVAGILTILISKAEWGHTYKRECLLLGWFIWLLGLVTYIFVNSVGMLFLAQVLGGIGTALSSPAFDAEFSESTAANLLGGWGELEGLSSIITGLATIIGCCVVVTVGFNAMLYVMISVGILSFGCLAYYFYAKKTA